MLVAELTETEDYASGKEKDEELEVHEEGRPGGRLVFGYGSNNGDVLLGISGVPEGIEAAGPRGNPAFVGEAGEGSCSQDTNGDDGVEKDFLELLGRDVGANELSERDDLEETKDAFVGNEFFLFVDGKMTDQVLPCVRWS